MATVRSFWHKGKLSPYEKMCLASFIYHGHEYVLYSYDVVDVPLGVKLQDANDIIPESEFFTYHDGLGKGSPSAFSNLFRYQLLLSFGDWWVDTDVVCLSSQLPSQDIVYAYEDMQSINGAVLKIPRNHHLAFELLAEAKSLGKQIQWGQAGPYLITRIVKKHRMEHLCLDPSIIYPVSYNEPIDLLRPDMLSAISSQCANASFLHLWNEVLRRSAIRKDITPPAGSYLRMLFDKHAITFPSLLEYSASEIEFIHLNSYGNRHRLECRLETLTKSYDDLLVKYRVLEDVLPKMPLQSANNGSLDHDAVLLDEISRIEGLPRIRQIARNIRAAFSNRLKSFF